MRLLLDTHSWLWWWSSSARLNEAAREALRDRKNELFFSVVSAWELAIKVGLGKLDLKKPLEEILPEQLTKDGVQLLALSLSHALAVVKLPHHHKDPFDRLLIAQAKSEGLCLLTADEHVMAYDVETLWAGEGSAP